MNRHILKFVSKIMKNIVIFLVYFGNVDSVPPEYCLHPLNRSDCNLKPTPVFSYYLSGSRCEIEYWRGCPTYNKFANQYECVDTCIYHYSVHPVNETMEEPNHTTTNVFEEELKALSEEDLDQLENVVEEAVEEVKKLKFTENVTEASPEVEHESTEADPETEHPEPEHHETEHPETEHPETEHPETEHSETEHPETEHPDTEPPATEPKAPEPEPTEAPTTAKEASDESGLPDEVELP